MQKTIAIIPARSGSIRLPLKNMLKLGEIPLFVHSLLFAKANRDIINEIYVSTNDEAIKKVAIDFGAKVIDRPENLSTDLNSTVSALKHVLETIDDEKIENVVLLQPTNPLRPTTLMTDCFKRFTESGSDSLFTISENHQKFGKIENDVFQPFNYQFGQRSQDLDPLFFENGLLYITKASAILNDKIITEDAFPFVVNHIFANVDIDTQEDFDYATYLYNKFITPNS